MMQFSIGATINHYILGHALGRRPHPKLALLLSFVLAVIDFGVLVVAPVRGVYPYRNQYNENNPGPSAPYLYAAWSILYGLGMCHHTLGGGSKAMLHACTRGLPSSHPAC